MVNEYQIKKFLKQECNELTSPTSSMSYRFNDIGELIDTFILLLNTPSSNQKLKNTGNKILQAITIISGDDLNKEQLWGALEAISTGFESYLKCISELKFGKNSVEFVGDGISYNGFLNSTLGQLLEGKVSKTNPRDNSTPALVRPIVPFSYAGTTFSDQIYGYIRENRNDIHYSPELRVEEILGKCRVSLVAFLLVLEHNILTIRKEIDPLFIYLQEIKDSYSEITNYFIHINASGTSTTEQRIKLPELEVIKWAEEIKTNNNLYQNETPAKTENSISNLLSTNKSIWVIGEPGSGKTTSLLHSVLEKADLILNVGYIRNQSIPIFIAAKLVSNSYNIEKYLIDTLKINRQKLDELLVQGKLWLVIDGINEISSESQVSLQKDIQLLFKEYEEFPICVTSRRYGFSQILPLDVYELVPLSWEKIEEYVTAYVADPKKRKQLLLQIRNGNDLVHDFAKNPLLLAMLIKIGIDDEIPTNFGQILKNFISWLLSREGKINAQINHLLKESLLSELAFEMKLNENRAINIKDAIGIIDIKIKAFNEKISAHNFIEEVLQNGLLVNDKGSKVSFFHELVLEYFTAIKLNNLFREDKESIIQFYKKPDWFESIIVLSGLLDNAEILVNQLTYHNITLAARCIGSGSWVPESSLNKIINSCAKTLRGEKGNQDNSLIALLELSNPIAFRLFIKNSAYIDQKTFNRVIKRCQRPDLTALKLLEFGLTGKFRVRQCLKVITSKNWDQNQINNEIIFKAEESLLVAPIEVGDLKLIANIGVHPQIKNKVEEAMIILLQESEGFNDSYVNLLETTFNLQLLENKEELVRRILTNIDSIETGDEFYLLFRSLILIKDHLEIAEIDYYINKVLDFEYFNLALKYIIEFKEILNSNTLILNSIIDRIRVSSRIQYLIQINEIFPQSISNDELVSAFREIASTTNNPFVFKFSIDFRELMSSSELSLIRENIINNRINFKAQTMIKWIQSMGCESIFDDLMIVTTFHPDRQFGFARLLGSGQQVYFNSRNKKIKRVIRKNDVFQVGHIVEPTEFENPAETTYRFKPKVTDFKVLN